VTADWCGL